MSKKKQKQPEPPAIELPKPETAGELVARLEQQQQEAGQAVPKEVPMSRLCIALVEFDLYDTINDAVYNAPEDTPEQRKQKLITIQWFERAQVARYDNPLLNAIVAKLGIPQEKVDDVFRFANSIPD